MKAKLIKESLSHDFSPSELYVVARSGEYLYESIHTIDTVYTDEGDARPYAMFLNSQGYKSGELTRADEYRVYTVQDLFNEISSF